MKLNALVFLSAFFLGIVVEDVAHTHWGHHDEPKTEVRPVLTGCLDNGQHDFKLSAPRQRYYQGDTWGTAHIVESMYRVMEETFDLRCTITHHDQIQEPDVKGKK